MSAIHFDNVVTRGFLDDWKFAHLLTIFSGANYSPSFSVQQANNTTSLSATNLSLVADLSECARNRHHAPRPNVRRP